MSKELVKCTSCKSDCDTRIEFQGKFYCCISERDNAEKEFLDNQKHESRNIARNQLEAELLAKQQEAIKLKTINIL